MKQEQTVYQDASQSIDCRVNDLLARMTVEEKCAQLGSYWVFELLENFTFSTNKAQKLLPYGIGQITRIGGASTFHPKEAADMANRIQKYLLEETRLGIPAMIHEECCSGLMTRGATLFPQAIGVAATWNPELTQKMTSVIRDQMRAIGAHQGLAPVLDVTRDPRWGRTEETMGEDPYLVAKMGCAYVRGLQEKDGKRVAVATGKHFVGYGNSEGGMNWSPCHIPERELHEVFLYPFEAAVKEAGLASIMNSYSELDGVPCCASKKLLREILRETWQFDGIVVSDYFAINMLYQYHKIARTKQEAANQALLAGIDVELPSTDCFGEPLRKALEDGIISMDELDAVVTRILAMKFALGIFDQPYVKSEAAELVFETAEQRKLAYTLAAESIVLLKNDHLLPLSPEIKSLAVIGPNADSWRNMIGDYAYPCHIETLKKDMHNGESPFGTPIPDDLDDISDALNVVTIFEAIKARVSPDTQLYFAQGCDVLNETKDGFPVAVAAAKKAEAAIVVVGDRAGLVEGCTSGEARDRAMLDLPGVQKELIQAVCATGTPVIVVLVQGRPHTLTWEHEHVQAMLSAWLPGEEGGNAVADVLFDKVNPGGKLPISFPQAVGQIPVFYGHKPSGGRSHWLGNYVEMSPKPLYPFGHGLSYTTFTYENLCIDQTTIPQDGSVQIEMDLRNSGACAGDEVVQLYVHFIPEQCIITRPLKELKGFTRVHLQAGATAHVTFTLHAEQLAFYQEDLQYALNPGKVEVMIGSSAEDLRLRGEFVISGESAQPVSKKVFFSEAVVSKYC
ncbi:glycoside hydrolase family 3 domain protein [Candidatus Vecturithrix granuli]|uniref:Glycoside hydrolase family 3 domain protein n=1 Tax=Vecturithrix granuli TaxID=1499967 RepID=A0A0S6W776_VECG1|nr:glycoside hydrolase family 3 domain protein [Candidatus Vecturithrix granuli]